MASSESDSLDDENAVYYKCHPKKRVSLVTCLICDNVYHISDFNRLENKVYISKRLVICPEHNHLDLTSNYDEDLLDENARKIVAQIKLNEKDKTTQELQKSIMINNSGDQDKLNVTMIEDDEILQRVKTENNLLRQLNTQLMDKNDLLKELVCKLKEENSMKTYASVAMKNNTIYKNKPPIHAPNLITKPNKANAKDKTYAKVVENFQNNLVIPVKTFQKVDGTIIVKCKNSEDLQSIQHNLKSSLAQTADVQIEKLNNPRLKIVNIEGNLTLDELQNDINKRNFANTEGQCIVEHIFPPYKNRTRNAIITVNATAYSKIRNDNGKIFIGYQCYKSYDDINIHPCKKCGRTGHSGSKCKNSISCLKCSGKHLTSECTSTTLVCTNCEYANKHYNQHNQTEHAAYDDAKCIILKNKINKKVSSTDYPIALNLTLIAVLFEKMKT